MRRKLFGAAAAVALLALGLSQPEAAVAQWTTNGNNINNTNTGNVGVGTSSPTSTLHVVGVATFGAYPDTINSARDIANFYISNPSNDGIVRFYNGGAGRGMQARFIAGLNGTSQTMFSDSSMWVGAMAVTGNSSAPDGNVMQFRLRGAADANNEAGLAAAARLTILGSGNVGVGTASPTHKLDVSGNMAVGSGYTSATTVPANGLIVQGGVGIGTSAPDAQYKLDVNGASRVTGSLSVTGSVTGGTIQATYQDVAEWVPSTQKLTAGTVVVLDGARRNHVLASAQPYDTRVAGVVSGQPGVLLGEGGEGRLMVATTGRVKVKVDATRGPISVGDLLVTSGVEGVAMKSVPVELGGVALHRPGTIIGKALEPLAQGVGEILVLLSLQ